jgi:hypothetical protein
MSDHAISLIAGAAPAARHSGRAQRDPESAQALASARWVRPAEGLVCIPIDSRRLRRSCLQSRKRSQVPHTLRANGPGMKIVGPGLQ